MQQEFLLSGFGGQGVMFAGQLLAYTAMDEGFEVTWIPSYGPEMRGGTAHCFVVVSDKPIGSPIVSNPQVAIVFNLPSFDRYENVVAPGGLLVTNASLIEESTLRMDITELRVPATEIADELGNLRLANVVMLGATLTARPVFGVEALIAGLDAHMPAHRRNLFEANVKAIRRGAAFAESLPTR